jgi:hypothetical protein
MEDPRVASCSCGQLQARVAGDPLRVSICHCLACQQRTGSAFGIQARFASDQVEITGESVEYVRFSDEDGEARSFHFCPRCGATVFYFFPETSYTVIPVGAFADPRFPAPRRSVWEERKHDWVVDPPGAETEA